MDILQVVNGDIIICTEKQNFRTGEYIICIAKNMPREKADFKNIISESLLSTEVKKIESEHNCCIVKIAN